MKRTLAALAMMLGATSVVTGQSAEQKTQDSPQERLRALWAIEAPGSVPVFYVAAAKERALRLQSSLEAAHAWYEKQLNMKVPILLAVADTTMWDKVQDLYAWMYYPPRPGPKLVVIRDQAQANAPRDADRDHAKGGILNNEHVLFHDDGHILTDAANIRIGNKSVEELIAQAFMVMYLRSERSDLNFVIDGFRVTPPPNPLRYTSMADFDYLDRTPSLTAPNAFWFLRQMGAVVDTLSKGRSFSSVIESLRKAFSTPARHELPDEIKARLESVWPGFSKLAGPLFGPSAISRASPSGCQESAPTNDWADVVIQNETTNPMTVERPNKSRVTIPERSWTTFTIRVGASINLLNGTCLVGREEPILSVIRRQ